MSLSAFLLALALPVKPVATVFPCQFVQYLDALRGIAYSNSANLPSGVQTYVNTEGIWFGELNVGTSLRAQQVSVVQNGIQGMFRIKCPLAPQSVFSSGFTYRFESAIAYGANALGTSYSSAASGSSKAFGAQPIIQTANVTPGSSVEQEGVIGVKRLKYVLPGSALTVSGNPVSIRVTTSQLGVGARSKNTSGGGRNLVVSTSAQAVVDVPAFTYEVANAIVIASAINSGAKQLECTVFGPSGSLLDEMTVMTDAWDGPNLVLGEQYGHCSLFMPDAGFGSYTLYFSTHKALRKRMDFQWNGQSSPSLGAINMVYGDLDQNGIITQAEYDAVVQNQGKSYLDEAWMSGSGPYTAWDCDLDFNGVVNAADLALISGNVGKVND